MKFSIITVVKNGISNIGLTIKSVKNQSYKNYEHIILDGNSTDGTTQYIKKRFNEKIVYFRESDKGLYDAINKSFKLAKGEYLIVLHSGDLFCSKNSLKILSKLINKNEKYDFYFSNILFYNKEKNKISRVWQFPQIQSNQMNFLKIAHTSLCIKKNVSNKLFYNNKFKISADIDYLQKLCKNFKGKYLNSFFIYMDDKGLSASKKYFLLKLKEDLKILYKEFSLFSIFILIYKILIKIPGFFMSTKKYNKKFILEIRRLIKL